MSDTSNPEDSLAFLKRMKAKMSPEQVAKMKAIDVNGVNEDVAHAQAMRRESLARYGKGSDHAASDEEQFKQGFDKGPKPL